MTKNLFVSLFLLPALISPGPVQPPPSKAVVVLLDLSESTRLPHTREAYAHAFSEILMKLVPGDRLVVGLITEKSVAELNLLINEEFFSKKTPLFGLLGTMVEEKEALEFNKKKDRLFRQVEEILADRNRKIMKTDIMSSFQVSDRILKDCLQPRKILVVLSDMLEDSEAYNFEQEALSDRRIAEIIALERNRDRIPDLGGVNILVVGAAAGTLDGYYSIQKFWLTYFREAGAIISKKDYGSAMLSFLR